MTAADLFKEKPMRWGFRGDPYLWDDLEQSFREVQLPYNEEDFREKLYTSIEEITGERLELGKNIKVEMYDHGGMSSGKISYDFWFNTAIPLLIERLNIENKRLQDKYQYGKVIKLCKNEIQEDHIVAHQYSSGHREKIENDKKCGCFYCLNIFSPKQITQWLSDGAAICPHCSIDSIIGESSGYPITREFLLKMKEYWF